MQITDDELKDVFEWYVVPAVVFTLLVSVVLVMIYAPSHAPQGQIIKGVDKVEVVGRWN